MSTVATSAVRRSSAFVCTLETSSPAAAARVPDGSTNEAVASMSVSASPRATTAVTRPTNTPVATSAAAQEIVGRAATIACRAVITVAGG